MKTILGKRKKGGERRSGREEKNSGGELRWGSYFRLGRRR